MASVAGSPDAPHGRSVLPWAATESGENITEALQALDTYKKKDPSKGQWFPHCIMLCGIMNCVVMMLPL